MARYSPPSEVKPGNSWTGVLDKDLLVNGVVVVERKGAKVEGTVTVPRQRK